MNTINASDENHALENEETPGKLPPPPPAIFLETETSPASKLPPVPAEFLQAATPAVVPPESKTPPPPPAAFVPIAPVIPANPPSPSPPAFTQPVPPPPAVNSPSSVPANLPPISCRLSPRADRENTSSGKGKQFLFLLIPGFIVAYILVTLAVDLGLSATPTTLFESVWSEQPQDGIPIRWFTVIPWAIKYFSSYPLHVLVGLASAWKVPIVFIGGIYFSAKWTGIFKDEPISE